MNNSDKIMPNDGVDLLAYTQICENIRQTMAKVVQSKTETNDSEKPDITELRMEGSFNFLSLKQLNRSAQIKCKHVKDQTVEAKQKLDGYNLQLENLQYEITHLRKEITKCLEFRSRHDGISLIPLQEFYNSAPPEISNPEVTKSDVHKQTLARLDYELEQRKELADNLEHLKKLRENLTEKIGDKKQNLQTLAPALENLLKTSLPLQEAFNLPVDHMKLQNDLACLLPRPLFVLFLQAKGYQEACDPLMKATIDGNAEQARRLKEKSENSQPVKGLISEDSDSDQEDIEDQDSRHSHRRKKEKSTPMEHDGVDDVADVFACHPLTVGIKLLVKNDGPTLLLTFTFLTNLNIVMVKSELNVLQQAESSSLLKNDTLLCCSLKDDFGLCSPNPSTAFLLQKSKVELTDVFSKVGRPYRWAQNLCGLVFLPNKLPVLGEDMQISFNHIQGTISALREKVISRLILARKTDEFSNSIVTYNGPKIMELPAKVHCRVAAWSTISFNDYKKLAYTGSVFQLGLLGSDEEAMCHDYFVAWIKRGSTVQLDAAVAVFCNYPSTPPLVSLSLQWHGLKTAENDQNIREMEYELNAGWPASVVGNHEIVALQMKRLMVLLDVYVETECDRDDVSHAVEFTLSKVCPRKTKGPARLKPYLYEAATKVYAHRGLEDN